MSRNESEKSSSDPRAERGAEPDLARPRLLLLRQLRDDDGEEDDVVDAEDDLHRREREQAEEDRGPRAAAHRG